MNYEEMLVIDMLKIIKEVPDDYQKCLRYILKNFHAILKIIDNEPFPDVDKYIKEAYKNNDKLLTCLLILKKNFDSVDEINSLFSK